MNATCPICGMCALETKHNKEFEEYCYCFKCGFECRPEDLSIYYADDDSTPMGDPTSADS
jgi:hypothetical protein